MNQNFCNILVVHACLQLIYHVTKAVQTTVVGSIVVVGVLTHWALLHCVCDLKVTQMNVQLNLIWKLMIHKFELDHNAAEATKNISDIKSEEAVDHRIVSRWFKKCCLDSKNFGEQARSGRPIIIDSDTVFKVIVANLVRG